MTSTLAYYNRYAERYTQANYALTSVQVDRQWFLGHLNAISLKPVARPLRLLDAGSGSGRDTLAFMEAGIKVDAFDGSQAMAAISIDLTGKPTRVVTFEEIDLPAVVASLGTVWFSAILKRRGTARVEAGRGLPPLKEGVTGRKHLSINGFFGRPG